MDQDPLPNGVDPETGEVVENESEAQDRNGLDFLQFVHSHRRGALNDDVTEELDRLVQEVMDIGKKGTLTLTLTVTPFENKLDPTITIGDEIKCRPPKRVTDSPIYFMADEHGQFSRDQPQQSIFGGSK